VVPPFWSQMHRLLFTSGQRSSSLGNDAVGFTKNKHSSMLSTDVIWQKWSVRVPRFPLFERALMARGRN
jgi:hypothetical protein